MYKIECFQTVGLLYFDRLKVTALNFLHPIASPPYQKSFFLRHAPFFRERVWVRGGKYLLTENLKYGIQRTRIEKNSLIWKGGPKNEEEFQR
jgi:hypothetical protein